VLGMKQELTLILSVPDPSSGTVTRIKNILWLTNFEEALMWHICCDGQIVTQSVWKSKALPDHLMLSEFGLLRTLNPDFGIQI